HILLKFLYILFYLAQQVNLTKNLAPIVLQTLKFNTMFKATFITIPANKRSSICGLCQTICDTG
ncbi:MAG: hypothetical protein ACLUJV_15550, partial [Blautia producta]